ncbi:g3072 [Coccomyxa elongata]
MGRRTNYDNRGAQPNNNRNTNQGVFGRLQQQPVNQQGGWGNGQRSSHAGDSRPGQQRDNNRFGAFNQPEQDRVPQNNRGGQRNPRQEPHNVDWRTVVRDDLKNERPKWPFSCYAHQRDGSNDLIGDYSFEEVRWEEMQAIRAGRSVASVVSNFNVASKALDQQWQTLSRVSRPPSMGGPLIEPPRNSFSAPSPFQPATPFGQVVGAFGSHPAAAQFTPSPAFGGPFQSSPAEAMPSAGPFTGAPAGTASPFGAQSAFGTPQPQAGPFQSLAQPQPVSVHFSGQQQGQQAQSTQGGSPFLATGQGVQACSVLPTMEQNGDAGSSPLNPWLAPAFERGKIPETPPPREVC